jgi:NAD(P)-dependent dehydrogenase (short-subunit alcohol dehydrogenase family)
MLESPCPMKVFLVPLGPAQHVPYSETGDAEPAVPAEGEGFIAGLSRRFRAVMAAAERTRSDHPVDHERGRLGRLKGWVLRWIADRIAEQRLLWHLRTCVSAVLVYPADLSADEAMRTLLEELRRDADRHLRWLIVNAVLLVLSGVLAIVPGPNLIAYYFAFRVVGHYLSIRGARHGLRAVAWTTEVSPVLRDLRTALHLEPEARHGRLRDIATRLDLPHLATFVERVALKSA